MTGEMFALAHALTLKGEPFALATVVRCDRPTSAKPGAKALIRKDGTVAGWIGGSCTEPVIVKEALRALEDGQPRFIALVGEGGTGLENREGVLKHAMTCHSGGTLEIFVEPVLPKLQLLLIGKGPVADTLAKLGQTMDFTVTLASAEPSVDRLAQLGVTPQTFIVVVTHGIADEDALEWALGTEARYVSLVASWKRAEAIVDALRARGVPPDRLRRLKSPAGLDIGAVTPAEIAASILAEIVQLSNEQRQRSPVAEAEKSGGAEATDPVCGMSVEIASVRYRSDVLGRSFYFCCARCKRLFDQDPARYVRSAAG